MDESPLERGNSCSPCIPHLSENETEESALANLISTGGEGTSSGRLASFSPQEPSTRRRRIDLNSDSEPEETTLLRTRTRIIRRPNRGVSTASSRTTQMVTAAVESNENASRRGRQARGRRARTPSFDLVNNINEYDLEEDSSRIGAVHNQMTEWMNRGRYNLNDPTDSSSESDEEEAWQRMVVVADEKMHFTKRQSKKQHSLLKMAVSVGNKTKVYQNRKEICVSCQQEEFVYSADPCGHAIFCSNCILAGIKPSKYTYTVADGTIATHHSYFVPVKCPLCRAIIGSLYKEAN